MEREIEIADRTFSALESLRNNSNVNYENVIEELESGNGFMPFWPVFGVGPDGMVDFVPTEEIYGQLMILSERAPGWAFSSRQPVPTQIPIEDLTADCVSLIESKGRLYSPGVNELDNMLRKLRPLDISGLLKMMELNESKIVLVPVIGLGTQPPLIYKIDADYFLDMLFDVYFDNEGRGH